jgi:hypothetical protein
MRLNASTLMLRSQSGHRAGVFPESPMCSIASGRRTRPALQTEVWAWAWRLSGILSSSTVVL